MSEAQNLISTTNSLPSPPALALKIINAVKDDDNDFNDLAEIIKADPALAGQLLKIANSSFYGLSQRVSSLSQATALLGTKTLQNIALSFVLVKGMGKEGEGSFSIDSFWRRCIANSVAAEVLAEQVSIDSKDIFVTALLQDIGLLVLFNSRPNDFGRLFAEEHMSRESLIDKEKEIFGYTHADVGSLVLKSWNLPASIYSPIKDHSKMDSDGDFSAVADLLYCADRIASVYDGTEPTIRANEAQKLLFEKYNLEPDRVDGIVDEVGEKAREMMDLFTIDPGTMKPISLIMQEANEELRRLNLSYEQVVFELQQAKRNAEKLAMELRSANERLQNLAFQDELTGLYNHRYFQETLKDEMYRAERFNNPLSLLMLDVDNFKNVNDNHGHLAGDLVLKEIGRTMNSLVRQSDIVTRYGGEEFAIILPETGISGAKVLGQRLRRGIQQMEISHDGVSVPVTISVGLASNEMKTVRYDKGALVNQCDQALYLAKRNGKNRLEMMVEQ